MFDGADLLAESQVVLISLTGGTDLAMGELNRVMEELNSKCSKAQVVMGAAIDPALGDRLTVMMVAARRVASKSEPAATGEGLNLQMLPPGDTAKPGSRFLPPPPELSHERIVQIDQRTRPSRPRKAAEKLRQGQLQLDIVSKGRFDKSEPTIHKGDDLDVPTYIRRGVALN
jgi:cell division protein FtsZ